MSVQYIGKEIYEAIIRRGGFVADVNSTQFRDVAFYHKEIFTSDNLYGGKKVGEKIPDGLFIFGLWRFSNSLVVKASNNSGKLAAYVRNIPYTDYEAQKKTYCGSLSTALKELGIVVRQQAAKVIGLHERAIEE